MRELVYLIDYQSALKGELLIDLMCANDSVDFCVGRELLLTFLPHLLVDIIRRERERDRDRERDGTREGRKGCTG